MSGFSFLSLVVKLYVLKVLLRKRFSVHYPIFYNHFRRLDLDLENTDTPFNSEPGGGIIIPQEVTDIAGMAFLGCPNLFHILRCATSEVMSSTAAIP